MIIWIAQEQKWYERMYGIVLYVSDCGCYAKKCYEDKEVYYTLTEKKESEG